jgi:TRAP-type mannitol/chloroaromatic compound transport system permease small subunit
MDRLVNGIDRLNERAGHIAKWLIVILTCILVYDVVLRYAFNAPTVWAFDISYMLGGSFFTLGMGYTLLKKSHVRIDVIAGRFSARTQALLDVILGLTVFFPSFLLLLYHLAPYVYDSWATGESSLESFWRPPIYPFKTVLLISVILLLLQGFAELVRSIRILRAGRAA